MRIVLCLMILLVATVVQAQVIGSWKDDGPEGIGTDITIYKSSGAYHLKQVFRDGSRSDKKVKKVGSKYIQYGSQDYYVIDRDGTLKCYDKQGLVFEARSVNLPKVTEQNTSGGQSCYQLGVKYGRCATLSMKGKACNPSDDIVIPTRCRGNADTQRGIEAGARSVY
ncbi:hypothetical protein [Geobacter sp. DSM 9736]|uniref:hypothetical protein n=1 Tax=Geobacter sp. DSM 9736 TaxID=1277350 RepID=UPI0012FD3BA9|nr:hypothetical protein [Geobacter sp. DSM 9736]